MTRKIDYCPGGYTDLRLVRPLRENEPRPELGCSQSAGVGKGRCSKPVTHVIVYGRPNRRAQTESIITRLFCFDCARKFASRHGVQCGQTALAWPWPDTSGFTPKGGAI